MTTVSETLMAPETGTATVDYTPVVHDLLTVVVAGRRRPRKLHALIKRLGVLVYPPLVLTAVNGDETGLDLEFVGPLWWLGSGGVGPTIQRREYVSGFDKLDNGSFLLDGLYWARRSEGSTWVLSGGNATNVGGLAKDDVLENDRKFPTTPGNTYRLQATGVTGTGSLRIRTIYEGRFNPPNILTNWLTTDALSIASIAKPQLITGSEFSSGAGWTLPATMAITGGKLVASPNVQPQYIAQSGFETGSTGWADVIGPSAVPMSDDIDIVNKPTEAYAGNWVMEVGPITQHQVLTNAGFDNSLIAFPYWYDSSDLADPDAVFYVTNTGMDGSYCAETDGPATAARNIKYLRADMNISTAGVQAYDVRAGEQYTWEVYVRASAGTDGFCYISLHIPHPTVPANERWYVSQSLEGAKVDDGVFHRIAFDLSIPSNRFKLDALIEVHDHNLGFWSFDYATVTRTRGNRAQMNSTIAYTVVPGTRYELGALMRSGGEMQVGSVRIGAILTGGAGVDPQIVDVDKGSTDYEWTFVPVQFTPGTGHILATPFVAGLDIVGEPAWIDNITLKKVENNTDTATHSGFTVIPDHRYLLSAEVQFTTATRGEIFAGVTLSGSGVTSQDVEASHTLAAGVKVISVDVRPGPGYTTATPYVRSKDVEGGSVTVDRFTLTKMDGNTAATTGSAIGVIPERTYRWTQDARSTVGLQGGTVRLSVTCTRSGYPDVVFDSPALEGTDGAVKQLVFEFTPPSGYGQVLPKVIGTDVEGGTWYVGNGQMRDTDTGSVVYDAVTTANPVGVSSFVDSTAPGGAETVRVAAIVMQGTTGWTVNSISLARTGVTPATGNAIVADLLKDPDSLLPLSLAAGTVTCPEVIPYDWVIENMTNRDALDHYCSVVSEPVREYRVMPTAPPTLKVGTQAVVFITHSAADALLPEDIDVEALSNPETNVEDRATEIEVIGAEVQTVSGRDVLITATSQVPGPVEYDYFNRAIVRTKQVSDGTVDHRGYAQAFADDLALRESEPALALNVKLSGIATRPDSPPGDTIYAYEPEAGLEDPTNPVTIEGATVFPRAVRVLARERSLGPSYTIEMRRSDGTTFVLPGIRWADEDATVLTVGDRLPSWIRDSQGKEGGEGYLRDRASRPR